ncbi:MAG: polyketide cyclase [Ferrovibrio sp.]|uniref:polyketide cyclase n=1 Tax=Ferrovibrio sp. TaxID=1917215 RepID=UPI003918B472
MATPMPCRHIGVTIDRPFAEVYAFLADPANWPSWASGLGTLRRQIDGTWVADQAGGRATIVFSPRNDFGVLDHRVITPEGQVIDVPLRAMPNGRGCDVVLTLYRHPAMDDATWARDQDWVRKDLERLATIVSPA